ncbi:hypothetical protein RR48_03061 [Papilio machaon]|uniref:Uncharacterized protein n=1 Tax=Papilio machaon TaxID=76193 RepID=A0A0N1IFD1_PAPMA|nr:hypothetical protein RR48_03061 [Papilio machaon]
MAAKCLIILTIVSLLGVVFARELKLTSKLKVDPGIFISLETLRRLEAKAKNNGTEGSVITNTTPADDLGNVDDSIEIDITTTSTPDNENNPISRDPNDPDVANETISHDTGENQTKKPLDSNETETDGSIDEPVTSIPNISETTKNPDTSQQRYPTKATSQQALLAYQKIQWPVPQYPYGPEQNYYQPNPYQQLSFGAVSNQQNLGYNQMHPVLFNQQLLYNYNDPQPFSVNPQASFDPNQHHQQTFIVQHPYPVLNQQSNPQMNLISLNPISMPLPYQQMYQPVVRN